jgi:hypothetical protein
MQYLALIIPQVKWTGRGDQQDLAGNIEEEIGSAEGTMG